METKPTIPVDVRRPEEFVLGHLPGAVNISLEEHPDYLEQLITLSERNQLLIYCYSGVRSAYIQSLLETKYDIEAGHLEGGLMLYQGPLETT